jgi:hypothetical protein
LVWAGSRWMLLKLLQLLELLLWYDFGKSILLFKLSRSKQSKAENCCSTLKRFIKSIILGGWADESKVALRIAHRIQKLLLIFANLVKQIIKCLSDFLQKSFALSS